MWFGAGSPRGGQQGGGARRGGGGGGQIDFGNGVSQHEVEVLRRTFSLPRKRPPQHDIEVFRGAGFP